MSIGQRIKERRLELNMTQKQLGELCGMADSAIRKYESGKIIPKHQTLQRIATALETPEWTLMGVEFERYSDGTRSVVVDIDSVSKEVAQKLTASADPKGIRVGLSLDSEAEEKAFAYLLENGDTSPEWTARLLTAFYKLNFPFQQMLVSTAENMVQHASFMNEFENIEQLTEHDTEE